MYDYTSYLNEKYNLPFEESLQIYDQLMTTLNFNDADTKMLWNKMIESAMNYAAIRSNWLLLNTGGRSEKDKSRTSNHNSFITWLNALGRHQEKSGKSAAWRKQFGDEKENRKRIGDFACFVAYIYGINAR